MTLMTASHRLQTALQQAGYAVAHSILNGGPEQVIEVTIVPSASALGYTQFAPRATAMTTDEIRRQGIVAMAGEIAMKELLDEGKPAAADSPFKGASLACTGVFLRARALAERFLFLTETPGAVVSDSVRDTRIQGLLAEWQQECRELVGAHKAQIRKVSDALLQREVLKSSDVAALLAE